MLTHIKSLRFSAKMRINAHNAEASMGYDRAAAKSRVNMTLNDDLVRQARALTPNLSETVERLLAEFIAQAKRRSAERQRMIDAHVKASNAFVQTHGSLADEFSTL